MQPMRLRRNLIDKREVDSVKLPPDENLELVARLSAFNPLVADICTGQDMEGQQLNLVSVSHSNANKKESNVDKKEESALSAGSSRNWIGKGEVHNRGLL